MAARAPIFTIQFPADRVAELAARFPEVDERADAAAGPRGYYRRADFIRVCAFKTVRSPPRVAANTAAAVTRATRTALAAADEEARMEALLTLSGVGVPTASTLLYFVFPAEY